jgi:hypothetical protein
LQPTRPDHRVRTPGKARAALLRAASALLLCAAASLLPACVPDSEDLFIDNRTYVPCVGQVPVCVTQAGCVLDAAGYTRGNFAQGSTLRAVVRTTVPSVIEVQLYFRTEGSPGTDTEIAFNEVGCRTRIALQSGGVDVFAEAGEGRVWSRKQQVFTPGDHLVEVFSDAQAEYLLKVNVQPTQ